MSINEEQELLSLVKDNNKMLKDIWTLLHQGSPNDDFKDLIYSIPTSSITYEFTRKIYEVLP